MNELTFDVVFHLAGAQIIPNYMGIRACVCPKHVVVVAEKTKTQRDRLQGGQGKCALRHVVF
jgi:hypothetical protein